MTKSDQSSTEALYRQLMEEIKERITVFEMFCVQDTKPWHGLPHARAYEFCYLELRFTCELIALACLVAHGDIAATKHPKIRKLWKPGVILDEMARLNPEFYPQAVAQKLDEKGRLVGWWAQRDPLKQEDLKTLWNECGGFLHRGNANDIDSQKKPDFLQLAKWHNKIIRLLSSHIICLVDRKSAFHVALSEEQRGQVVMTAMVRWPSGDGGVDDWYAPRGPSQPRE